MCVESAPGDVRPKSLDLDSFQGNIRFRYGRRNDQVRKSSGSRLVGNHIKISRASDKILIAAFRSQAQVQGVRPRSQTKSVHRYVHMIPGRFNWILKGRNADVSRGKFKTGCRENCKGK